MEAQGSLCFAARSMTRAPRQDTGARSEIRDGASYATRSLALVETTETMEWVEINCTDYILQAIRCTRRLHHLRTRHAFESKVWITTSIVAAHPHGRFWPCLTRPIKFSGIALQRPLHRSVQFVFGNISSSAWIVQALVSEGKSLGGVPVSN